jgi:hypothetical protein
MKVILDYDEVTNEIRDASGVLVTCFAGLKGFESEQPKAPVLELIKQGVSPDEIIKLRNNDLL